jgi:predicted naringenin-chalcone synthase
MLSTLSDFQHIRPHHETDQEKIQEWIVEAHTQAAHRFDNREMEHFRGELNYKMERLGLGKERIEKRGIHISDHQQDDWSKMEIYPVKELPHGRGFAERSSFFDREVSQIFERFYPENSSMPAHLIHVTCTGYVAPSPAQKLVSLRKAGMATTVTHAYHMGCYGSIPAIRMGSGFASLPSPSASSQVDIVHTEICSLHMHPLRHASEQLLVQSLFGDGFIKYTLNSSAVEKPHLSVLALHEETIPDSTHCMTWRCEDQGLGMTLSKDVPILIARSIEGYLERLCAQVKLDSKDVIKEAFFAIHPGGPKILQQIKDLLKLSPEQIEHSVQILKDFGNMSSATLPHVWEKMLADPKVPCGKQIISLAFGPGLSIAGGLFEKQE